MIHIVLFQPEKPPNTGNIGRTCVLTGSKLHLIRPLGFSLSESAVKRAGLDYWDKLDLEIHDSWEDLIKKYGDRSFFLSTTKATKLYTACKFPDECFVIFGSESSGVPMHIHEQLRENRFKVPMKSGEGMRSLNLSNTVAIVLYEALKQNGFRGVVND